MSDQPTLDEVRTWPATVSIPQAARALGCSQSKLYALTARGECPVRTLTFGKRVVIITASLIRVLSGEDEGSSSGPLAA